MVHPPQGSAGVNGTLSSEGRLPWPWAARVPLKAQQGSMVHPMGWAASSKPLCRRPVIRPGLAACQVLISTHQD